MPQSISLRRRCARHEGGFEFGLPSKIRTKIFLKDYIANELAAFLAEAKAGAATAIIRCAFGMLARKRVAKRRKLLLRIEAAAAELPSSARLVNMHSELSLLDKSIADRALAAAISARCAQLKAKPDRCEIDLLARFVEEQKDTWLAVALSPVRVQITALVAGFLVDDAEAALAVAVAKRDEAQINTALTAGEALGVASAHVAAAKQLLTELAFLKLVEQAAASNELGALEAMLKEASSLGLDAAREIAHAQSVKAALLLQHAAAEHAAAEQAEEEARIRAKAVQALLAPSKSVRDFGQVETLPKESLAARRPEAKHALHNPSEPTPPEDLRPRSTDTPVNALPQEDSVKQAEQNAGPKEQDSATEPKEKPGENDGLTAPKAASGVAQAKPAGTPPFLLVGLLQFTSKVWEAEGKPGEYFSFSTDAIEQLEAAYQTGSETAQVESKAAIYRVDFPKSDAWSQSRLTQPAGKVRPVRRRVMLDITALEAWLENNSSFEAQVTGHLTELDKRQQDQRELATLKSELQEMRTELAATQWQATCYQRIMRERPQQKMKADEHQERMEKLAEKYAADVQVLGLQHSSNVTEFMRRQRTMDELLEQVSFACSPCSMTLFILFWRDGVLSGE